MAFSKILIANRGEIACRVIETAKTLGYPTVAVFSDADRGSRHVQLADEAIRIGPAPVGESYLVIDHIMKAAKETGADAIHPGYGFLSENCEFAKACSEAGIVFIGPPPGAIELMGSKRLSKIAMLEAKVPCIPGYEGESQEPATLLEQAKTIGFPVMIKASAGGGGRGMRLVHEEEDFLEQMQTARSEAENAFGNGELILEKAVVEPRHVEIQVFADTHGNVIHLGERDCSIQRRHQKVVEESPSPFVGDELRGKMGDAAVNVAKACNYVGAGTVEFLVDSNHDFYFLEMNTRLQVEHPVTEMVTGQDLVAWQIKVAAGETLPLSQDDVSMQGHAIEVRIYAEDPANQFFPQTGRVLRWDVPTGEGIRIDHGLVEGYEISPFYDPMLAKVIAHGETRDVARRKLAQALRDFRLFGVRTNQGFLEDVINRDRFINGEATTAFIQQEYPDGVANIVSQLQGKSHIGLAAAIYHRDSTVFGGMAHRYGWSNGMAFESVYLFEIGDEELKIGLLYNSATDDYRWRVEGEDGEESGTFSWNNTTCGQGEWIKDGIRQVVHFYQDGTELFISTPCGVLNLTDITHRPAVSKDGAGSGRVVATMDGAVIGVPVEKGQAVECGQTVVVLEAMKMEHSLKSDVVGIVEEVSVSPGDQVKGKQLLVVIKPKEAA